MKFRASGLLALPLMFAAAAALCAEAYPLNIPAQPLTKALQTFATQSGLSLVHYAKVTEAKIAPALEGTYTSEQALTRLLQGTGLKHTYVNERTIEIRPTTNAGRAEANEISEVRAGDWNASIILAQAETQDTDAVPRPRAQPAPRESRRDTLEEVVVSSRRATTATKTDAPLIKTPQAISVIEADQFLAQGALNYDDTVRYSSGVTGETFGLDTRNATVNIRGMSAIEYLDGMRRNFGFLNFARTDVYTLERVEILRGPSSVLYGAGGAGGIVNQVSKRPRFERFNELGLQYGSHDRRQLQFDMTGPLGSSDRWAARLVGVAREADTQVDFVPDDRLLLMPSLTWKPGDRTSMTLIGQWREDRLAQSAQAPPLVASLLAPPGRRVPDSLFGGEPGHNKYDVDQQQAGLFVDHRFSEAISFSSALRYTYSRTENNNVTLNPFVSATAPFIDDNNEVMPRRYFDTVQRAKVLTTDNKLQIDFDTGPFTHQFLAGVDYQSFRQVTDSAFGAAAPLNIYRPEYGNIPQRTLVRAPTQRLSQIGFYLQDQIGYGDRVHLLLGGRRDRACAQNEGASKEVDNVTTFRAAAIVDVWKGLSPYISYAESFRPVAGVGFFGERFVPQEGIQYEVGIKWQPEPATLLTLAAFDLRDTNRFTNHPTDAFLVVQQGEVQSRGIELEASHTFFDSLEVIASYTDFDAEISESNNPAEIGRPLDAAPGQLASAWGVKRFDIGADVTLRVGAGVRYVGESLSSGTLRIPSYTLLDALAAVDWGQRWTLSVNATNLSDKRYYSTCLVRGDCWPGARRYVVGAVNFNF